MFHDENDVRVDEFFLFALLRETNDMAGSLRRAMQEIRANRRTPTMGAVFLNGPTL